MARRLAWSIWAAATVLWAVCVWLYVASGLPPIPDGSDGGLGELGVLSVRVAGFLGVSTIAAIVAVRQPGNLFGWTAGIAALMSVIQVFANRYTAYSTIVGEWPLLGNGAAIAWFAGCLSAASVALVTVAFLVMPSGQLSGPRWRIVVAIGLALGAIGVIAAALSPGPLANTPWVINPLGAPAGSAILLPMATLATLGGLVCILAAAASVPLRLRRAQGDERLQIKWIVYGTCIFAVGYALTVVVPREWVPAVRVPYLLSVLAFVVTLGVAMLKYRLYSVDLVISRSLLYGALAVTITAVYVGVVAGVGTLAHTTGQPNLALSLVATAIVAVLFQPARARLQRLANRLVYGQRASPYDVLAGFSRRVAHALSVDQVLPLMAETAAHGVGASRSLVRVHVPDGTDRVVGWPTEPNGESIDRIVPVLHHGELVGEIGVAKPPGDPLRPTEQALLDDLAAQAGPALSNVRLTEDLRASRQRIVSAQDQERRRIERDLHDGAQQQLVVLAINARLALEVLATDHSQVALLLAEIELEAKEALAALRDLARGIYPPVLADRGLVAALSDHIIKAAPRTRLEVDPVLGVTRFAPALEAGVYFCCLEALQNAAKYAQDATVVLSLTSEPGCVSFQVVDDGPGFDAAAPRTGTGTGLLGMADRLAALGGCLELESTPGHGTRVIGRVPSDRP